MAKRLEHVEVAEAEAIRLGATIEFERRTNHICGIIAINGQSRKIFLSISPRDCKLKHVVKEDVRKRVREMQT